MSRTNTARRPLGVERLDDRLAPAVVTPTPLGGTGGPAALVAGPGGVWYTDPVGNAIGRLADDGTVKEFPLPTAGSDPRGIAVGADGNLWFTLFGTDQVGRLNPSTGAITSFTVGAGSGPSQIVAGPDGRLWFTQFSSDQIGAITTAGVVSEYSVPGAGSQPLGITTNSEDGNLWFTEYGSNEIGTITTAGVVAEYAVPGAGSQPLGITTDARGLVWFTEYGSSQIGLFTPYTASISEFDLPTAGAGPAAITATADSVYFTSVGTHTLTQFIYTVSHVSGDRLSFYDEATGLDVGQGDAVAASPSGAVLVAERGRNQITTVSPVADLSVTASATLTAFSGDHIDYTIVVSNAPDGDPVSLAKLAAPLPPGLDQTFGFYDVTTADGDTTHVFVTFSTAQVSLPPGGTATIVIKGLIPKTFIGDLTLKATVSTQFTDSNPANNTAVAPVSAILPPVDLDSHFAVGTDAGSPGQVTVFDAGGTAQYSLNPFSTVSTAGNRVVTGDFNFDGVPDFAVATGPGVPNAVQLYDGKTHTILNSFIPFEPSFNGGVNLSIGDTGSNVYDLIVSPDVGGGPRVDVYNVALVNRDVLVGKAGSFLGIDDPNFRGGVRTAVGDVNGDGRSDIAVAAGVGGGPRVAIFDGNTITQAQPARLVNDFFAFESTLRNGVTVALADLNADAKAEVIVGGGPGGGPRVTVFDPVVLLSSGGGTLTPVANFFAGDPANRGGVRLTVKSLDGDNQADLVVGAGDGSRVTGYLGGAILAAGNRVPDTVFDFDAFANFTDGVFVG